VAVDTILRHEATGRQPEELIRLLGGRGQHNDNDNSSSSPTRRKCSSSSESSTHSLRRVDLDSGHGPVALNMNRSVSEGGVPSCVFLPPPSTSVLEREGIESNALSCPFEQQQMQKVDVPKSKSKQPPMLHL